MKTHSLITTLINLRGNPRGCVFTEPLWGIPFNLYAPYISIYMLAMGLTDSEIGLLASIGTGFQVIMALFSGVITDKLGRRLTTLIFDIVAWSVPALISALAQNFWYFLAAAIINSVWRITHNSWTCLLVEDAEPRHLADIFSWINIALLLAGLIAPLTGPLISAYSLVPTVRGLYFFAAFMFTVKAVVTYMMTEETAQGRIRMHETQHQSPLAVLSEYRHVFIDLLRTSQTLYTAGIMLIVSITTLISGTFWAVLVSEKLNIPNADLWLFAFLKSVVMILFFFVVMPRISLMQFKLPMTAGFLGFIVSQIVLITVPAQNYAWLILSVLLEAFSLATIGPLVDRLTTLTIAPKERARIMSIIAVGIILLTSPFGWIAGKFSEMNKDLPFILNIALFAVGALLAYLAGRASNRRQAAEAESAMVIDTPG